MKNKISISVVVCTRNRLEHLKNCLLSLLKQSYPPKEIIIVDDCSYEDFNVYEYIKNYIAKLKDRLLETFNDVEIILIKNKKNVGIATSRNVGVKTATGDIIAFLDDDGFAHKHWLKNLAKNYEDKKILGVGGPVVEIGRSMKTPQKLIKKLAYIKNGKIFANYRIKEIRDTGYLPKKFVHFLQGGNMSFRRDVLLHVKGCDTNLIGNCYREETDLSFRVAKNGKLLFEPYAITYHNTAKKGGCRDVIDFDLDKFLYYMYRNTTYFFFKHFNFKKALRFTAKSVYRQIKLIKRNKTGLTRDYLRLKDIKKSIGSVVVGTLLGFCSWLKLRNKALECICGEPISLQCFKLMLIGNSLKLIELKSKTNFIKKLFGI